MTLSVQINKLSIESNNTMNSDHNGGIFNESILEINNLKLHLNGGDDDDNPHWWL